MIGLGGKVILPCKSISQYKPFLIDNKDEIKQGKKEFILKSGRIGGKTVVMIQKMLNNIFQYRNRDIVVLRANSSAMKESIFLEFKKYCASTLPLEYYSRFIWRETPPMLITSPFGNQIRFGGVGLGSKSGSNQSKGKVSERKLSLLVVEETQEIFMGTGSADLLKNAIATYIRLLDDEIGKIVYAGNTERNKLGKFNLWVEEMRKDKNVTIIETSWLDIKHFLNKATIQLIEREYEINPQNAKYLYGGEPVGGINLVYGSFNETLNIVPYEINKNDPLFTLKNIFAQENVGNINQLYIGVDGAQTRDKMVFEPIFQFRNAKLILKTGDILYHDPIKNGIITNTSLVQNYVRKWFSYLYNRYILINKPIIFVVDGHCTDIIENLRYEFAKYPNVSVVKFTKKNLLETTKTVNNAFGQQMLYIGEEDWKEIISDDIVHSSIYFQELETVCWDEEDGTKLNDSIPNDLTDALRYPVAYHENPYQMDDFRK